MYFFIVQNYSNSRENARESSIYNRYKLRITFRLLDDNMYINLQFLLKFIFLPKLNLQ